MKAKILSQTTVALWTALGCLLSAPNAAVAQALNGASLYIDSLQNTASGTVLASNGASLGLQGLSDLGISIDPVTKLASLDTSRLDGVLASNKAGDVATVQEFSANFAKSAELLNSAGNFIPSRLGNLDRVIHYIADNKTALQEEFGLGDPAKPTGQVSQALAAYNSTSGA